MPVDFDTVPNRRGTNCFKYDFAREMGMPEDVLPLWVADMDFPTAPAVLERLHALAEHGIFGYTGVKDAYFSAVHNWYAQRFSWETQRGWLVTTPGVVFAIAIAIRAFTQKGDAILIQQPVYYPFANKVTENDRQLVVNPLVLKNGRYEMDFADMERKIVDYHVKMLLLCSPHNPVGRVWTKEELLRVGEICQKHGVLVVSDEIHADFTYAGHTHRVFASVKSEFAILPLHVRRRARRLIWQVCKIPTFLSPIGSCGMHIKKNCLPAAAEAQTVWEWRHVRLRMRRARTGWNSSNNILPETWHISGNFCAKNCRKLRLSSRKAPIWSGWT